jgi:hypothetical protein
MSTHCSERSFDFEGSSRRKMTARFDGGTISSDGGVLLLQATEKRTRILERFAGCFLDHRDAARIDHSVGELASQRVLGLCLGYEDLSDHELLRKDPLLCAVAGKHDPKHSLAGKSTLSRLELSTQEAAATERYTRIALDGKAVDRLLAQVFLESFERAPERIVLDLDATNFAIHGRQEGRFFHGFYDQYCYLPLYIFAGEHLLCARLRPSNIDASSGSKAELEPIVQAIRARFPGTKLLLRADSGFCREELMSFCEAQGIDYVFGLARNSRLEAMVQYDMGLAQMAHAAEGQTVRRFVELTYKTLDTWARARRVVAKAEHGAKGDNPRFVVTSLGVDELEARALYEDLYCARGDMENRIKEQQLGLFAERVSAATIAANQVRLYFASIGYTLLHALRRLGLAGSDLARAQCDTIRTRLLKIGARVRVSVRRVWISLSEAFPLQEIFAHALDRLRAPPEPV